MTTRRSNFRGYNVLDKVATPSWDDPTRMIVNERMSVPLQPRFFEGQAWCDVQALCRCVVPQASYNPQVPLAQMLDAMLQAGIKDGYRDARMPRPSDAWRIGVSALAAEAKRAAEGHFADMNSSSQTVLLNKMQAGKLFHPAWQRMPPALFFSSRVLHDICSAYYSHPHSWSEIGFGGPANPRGYVRLYFNRKDPWEATEIKSTYECTSTPSPEMKTGMVTPASKESTRVR